MLVYVHTGVTVPPPLPCVLLHKWSSSLPKACKLTGQLSLNIMWILTNIMKISKKPIKQLRDRRKKEIVSCAGRKAAMQALLLQCSRNLIKGRDVHINTYTHWDSSSHRKILLDTRGDADPWVNKLQWPYCAVPQTMGTSDNHTTIYVGKDLQD